MTTFANQLIDLNSDDLGYPRTEVANWVARFVTLCQQSGVTIATNEDGLPLNFTAKSLLSADAAARDLLQFVEQEMINILPVPPTDWTKNTAYQSAANVSSIDLGLSVLDAYQAEPIEQRITPFTQAIYPMLLGLVIAQVVDVTYESVQQASAMRLRLHGHLDFIVRELLANQKNDAISAATSGEIGNALRDLLVISRAAAESQMATLPHVVQSTLKREQPLRYLLWQHQQEGNLDDFMQRNGLLHPLFIPAERTIEILKQKGSS